MRCSIAVLPLVVVLLTAGSVDGTGRAGGLVGDTRLERQGGWASMAGVPSSLHYYLEGGVRGLLATTAQSPRALRLQGAPASSPLDPVSSAPQCVNGTYTSLLQGTLAECLPVLGSSTLPLSYPLPSNESVANRWATYCSTHCVKMMSEHFVNTVYEECMSTDLRSLVVSSQYLCTARSTGATPLLICGNQYSRLLRLSSCGNFNETECSIANDVCAVYTKKGRGSFALVRTGLGEEAKASGAPKVSCRPKMTEKEVAGACEGGCVTGLIERLNPSPSQQDSPIPRNNKSISVNSFQLGLKMLEGSICLAKGDSGDDYCLPSLDNELNALDEGSATTKTLDSICFSKEKLLCFQKFANMTTLYSLDKAKDTLSACSESVHNDAGLVATRCLPAFRNATVEAKEGMQQVKVLCTKNHNQHYCLPYLETAEHNSCVHQARDAFYDKHKGNKGSHSNNCNRSHPHCAKSLTTLAGHMGCCLGTLQEALYTTNSLTTSDFPKQVVQAVWPGTDAVPADSYYATPYDGYLASMGLCGANIVKKLLTAQCGDATSKSKSKGDPSSSGNGLKIFAFLSVFVCIGLLGFAYTRWDQRRKAVRRARVAVEELDLDTPPVSPTMAARTGTHDTFGGADKFTEIVGDGMTNPTHHRTHVALSPEAGPKIKATLREDENDDNDLLNDSVEDDDLVISPRVKSE